MMSAVLLLLLLFALAQSQLIAPLQHKALMEFYDATGCPATVCVRIPIDFQCPQYVNLNDMITCRFADIQRITIRGVNLTGSIPENISLFTKLKVLQLDNNQLTGSAPSNLSRLIDLETLDLSNNRLTGEFPSLSLLTKLTNIDVRDNFFHGKPPDLPPKSLLIGSRICAAQDIVDTNCFNCGTAIVMTMQECSCFNPSIPRNCVIDVSSIAAVTTSTTAASTRTPATRFPSVTFTVGPILSLPAMVSKNTLSTTTVSTTTSGQAVTTAPSGTTGTAVASQAGNEVQTSQMTDSSGSTNVALIGGVVGGVAALLLVGGIVGAVVLSRRRARAENESKGAVADSDNSLVLTPASTMDTDTTQQYAEPADVRSGHYPQF